MAEIRIREVIGTLKVVDSDSLLSGAVMERIVSAVVQSLAAAKRDEQQRRRDVQIGGGGCDDCHGEPS